MQEVPFQKLYLAIVVHHDTLELTWYLLKAFSDFLQTRDIIFPPSFLFFTGHLLALAKALLEPKFKQQVDVVLGKFQMFAEILIYFG